MTHRSWWFGKIVIENTIFHLTFKLYDSLNQEFFYNFDRNEFFTNFNQMKGKIEFGFAKKKKNFSFATKFFWLVQSALCE